jgi:competence protein ComEA
MGADKLNRWWLIITGVLVLIIAAAGAFYALNHKPGQEILVSMPNSTENQYPGQVLIDGAVSQPGFYPMKAQDNIASMVAASGGPATDADLSAIRIYIPRQGETQTTQKVDINRAESWLLEALPGIGSTKAQAIVDYRRQNGPFHNTQELTFVTGISDSIFQKIKDLITVSD